MSAIVTLSESKAIRDAAHAAGWAAEAAFQREPSAANLAAKVAAWRAYRDAARALSDLREAEGGSK